MRPAKHKKRVADLKREGKWIQKPRKKMDPVDKLKINIMNVLKNYVGRSDSFQIRVAVAHEVNELLFKAWTRGEIAKSEVREVTFDRATGHCNVTIDAAPREIDARSH